MISLLPIKARVGLLAMFTAGTACGTVVPPALDQSQLFFHATATVAGNGSLAQTFTPSLSGQLAFVDLYLGRNNANEANPLFVSIAGTQSGSPGQVLGTLSQTFFNAGGLAWYRYDFSSLSLALTANTLYAVVLSNPGSTDGIGAGGALGNPYAGGQALATPGGGNPWTPSGSVSDLMFATYMTPVPEPSAVALGILGLGAMAWCRRTRHTGNCGGIAQNS